MNDSDQDPEFPPFSRRIATLAGDPDAPRWALECGWVPGSGACRSHPCSPECLFREQREAEASRIEHERRQRRREQRGTVRSMRRLH